MSALRPCGIRWLCPETHPHPQPGFTRIATGEAGVSPKIIVWDVTTMECVYSTRYVPVQHLAPAIGPDLQCLAAVSFR
jgi:hypothetical protein